MDHVRGRHLLCGGPVNIHPKIANAVTEWSFSHRDPECRQLIAKVSERLNAILGLHKNSHHVALTTGSGTTANEMVLASVVPEQGSVLVLSNGAFGDRLAATSKVYNNTTKLDFGWSGEFSVQDIERELDERRPDLVAMVHGETSVGLLTPVDAVSKLCQDRKIPLFVDMVSSFGADYADFCPENIAYLTSSSGKSLGALPGIAIVFAARDQLAVVRSNPAKTLSLNLARTIDSIELSGHTPNTVAVHLLAGLDAALELIEREGVEKRLARISSITNYLHDSLIAAGWTIKNRSLNRSNAVTCVQIPDCLTYEHFAKFLGYQGFSVHRGKGPYRETVFQVSCTVGVDQPLVDEFCQAICSI